MSEAGWWTNAKVGDKVVCIKIGTPHPELKCNDIPKVGNIYEIASIELIPELDVEPSRLWIELVGIKTSLSRISFFRPVQTKSTKAGMAVFKEILDRESTPTPVKKAVTNDA